MTDERRINRMAGCACFGKIMLVIGLLALILFFLFDLQRLFLTDSWPDQQYMKTRQTLKELRQAIEIYELEFNRLPGPLSDPQEQDFAVRSRDPFLTHLLGKEGMPDNHHIKLIDLPLAKNHTSGIWKDGSERVLSDSWGEPYYIVIDTNKDGQIANPEFGADPSDAKYAKRRRSEPPPATLPVKVLVYSSGPDRDPKTWHDNICSWRSH